MVERSLRESLSMRLGLTPVSNDSKQVNNIDAAVAMYIGGAWRARLRTSAPGVHHNQ